MTYLYLEHINRVSTNIAWYTEYEDRQKWVMYDLQRARLSRIFELLPEFVATALGMIKAVRPTTAVVDHNEQRLVMERRPT